MIRYIALNPVRAGLCRAPEDWPWSSYAATLGYAANPQFLESDWLLTLFGSNRGRALDRLRAFVETGAGSGECKGV